MTSIHKNPIYKYRNTSDSSLEKKGVVSKELFFKPGVLYSVTLNPIDKYQYYNSPDRLSKFRSLIYEGFLTFPGNYRLFIEYSEPRGFHIAKYTGPRLHLHGTIKFRNWRDVGEFLKLAYYRILRYSSVDIDVCNDPKVWHDYCTKQGFIKPEMKMITNYTSK